MFQQRPMPPMNSRSFIPRQGQMPMNRQSIYRPYQNPMMGGGQFSPQMQARSGGGLKGLLSRIMPGNQGAGAVNPQGLMQGITGASRTTGALQGITNPANISSMLGNVQKVLGMAQQVTPMVQQYGPLVKNLPAMIKIYRELNNSSNEEAASPTDDSTEKNLESSASEMTNHPSSKQKDTKQPATMSNRDINTNQETKANNKDHKRPAKPKSSKPKMYI
jgi:YqfQ-like protein